MASQAEVDTTASGMPGSRPSLARALGKMWCAQSARNLSGALLKGLGPYTNSTSIGLRVCRKTGPSVQAAPGVVCARE